MVERRAQGDAAVVGDAPVGRLDRADARQRGRDPQRAGGVRAHRRRDHARRQRRRRAAARPAGRAVGRPRVGDLVGGPAGGELVGVAVPGEDQAVGAQAPPHRAVGGGDAALEHAARRRQAETPDGEEVLEREGDPARQRRGIALGGQARVGCPRQLGGELGVQARPRVDGAGRAVEGRRAAVARGDPRLAGLEQLDGRQRARDAAGRPPRADRDRPDPSRRTRSSSATVPLGRRRPVGTSARRPSRGFAGRDRPASRQLSEPPSASSRPGRPARHPRVVDEGVDALARAAHQHRARAWSAAACARRSRSPARARRRPAGARGGRSCGAAARRRSRARG